MWCFQPHLPALPALCHVEAPPADSLLRSLYERKEEGGEDQEEKSQEVFGPERSFEVWVQQDVQKEGQKEGWSGSELHFLLYSLKPEEMTESTVSLSDAESNVLLQTFSVSDCCYIDMMVHKLHKTSCSDSKIIPVWEICDGSEWSL